MLLVTPLFANGCETNIVTPTSTRMRTQSLTRACNTQATLSHPGPSTVVSTNLQKLQNVSFVMPSRKAAFRYVLSQDPCEFCHPGEYDVLRLQCGRCMLLLLSTTHSRCLTTLYPHPQSPTVSTLARLSATLCRPPPHASRCRPQQRMSTHRCRLSPRCARSNGGFSVLYMTQCCHADGSFK